MIRWRFPARTLPEAVAPEVTSARQTRPGPCNYVPGPTRARNGKTATRPQLRILIPRLLLGMASDPELQERLFQMAREWMAAAMHENKVPKQKSPMGRSRGR